MRQIAPRLLGLAFCLGGVTPLQAQLHDYTYGAMAGISVSKAGGSDVGGLSKTVYGIAVGGFLTLGLTRGIAVEPQLLMVEKGIKTEEGGLRAQVKLSYLQLPLLLKLRFPIGSTDNLTGYVFGGGALAYKVGCRLTLASDANEVTGGCSDDEESSEVKSFDSSAIIGLGAEVGRATFSIRYDLGLGSIDGSSEANDIRHRAILITAGAKMRLNP